jgi:iron complex transport system ATP-binding protein
MADRNVAEAELDEFGVSHLADQPYAMISGGERQLVLIARALAQELAYVVLDEPTASLDFDNQGKVMRQIGLLTAKGLGVLFTTHDPNQALRHANRVALLNDGKLAADGQPADVLTVAAIEGLYEAGVEQVSSARKHAFLPL